MESKKKDSALVRSSAAEYLTFVASTGEDKDSIEMRYEDENIWLTQKMMATLYDVGLPTINEHIKKIYADHEQDEAATIRKFRIVQNEGGRQVTRNVNHYNLQKLKEPETRKYLANAFRDGEIKTVGTDIDKLMPPVSRFGGGGRAQKKQGVIDKLKSFFDKFFGIGGSSMAEDDSK